TLASSAAMGGIGDLLVAPVEAWDAVVCTSEAGKAVVTKVLEDWSEYLARRLRAKPSLDVKLPVIPLGVDCHAFPECDRSPVIRRQLRGRLGIADDDFVVLFVGRLIFYGKAHPVPMYLALEKAARSTQRKVHLLLVGWFEDEREERAFRQAALDLCPS